MLDSIADHIFYPSVMISLYIIAKEQIIRHLPLIIYLGAWWMINFLIKTYRIKKIKFYHLWSFKITVAGIVIYTIITALTGANDKIFMILIILLTIRMIEETITYLRITPETSSDIRSYKEIK